VRSNQGADRFFGNRDRFNHILGERLSLNLRTGKQSQLEQCGHRATAWLSAERASMATMETKMKSQNDMDDNFFLIKILVNAFCD
jgi:hypothetical protein